MAGCLSSHADLPQSNPIPVRTCTLWEILTERSGAENSTSTASSSRSWIPYIGQLSCTFMLVSVQEKKQSINAHEYMYTLDMLTRMEGLAYKLHGSGFIFMYWICFNQARSAICTFVWCSLYKRKEECISKRSTYFKLRKHLRLSYQKEKGWCTNSTAMASFSFIRLSFHWTTTAMHILLMLNVHNYKYKSYSEKACNNFSVSPFHSMPDVC